jgi:MFS family permease
MSSPAPARPYRVLRHRDYRRIWIAQLVSLTGSQMQVAALHWHVYLLTRSPLALGLVGLTRVLPVLAFSLWGGVLADRADRRRLMLATQVAMTGVASALALFTKAGKETVALLFVLNAAGAAASAFDGPARQALIPRLVPAAELQSALALNLTVFHVGMIGGPAVAGLLLAGAHHVAEAGGAATRPLALLYGLNALSFVAVIFALLRMDPAHGRRAPAEGGEIEEEPALRSLASGLRFVFGTPLMVWTMALDFFATFFSGAMSLLPIFADQVLHAGPRGYGLLVAAPAAGALLGSLWTSWHPLGARQGRLFLWAVAGYGVATVVFGLSRSFALTFLALAAAGLADLVSTVVRQTLRQLVTPDALRGRMTSVNMIFFMGGPQLGEVEAGFVASLFASAAVGATVSVVSGGLATIAVAAVVAFATPVVRRYELEPPRPPSA